MGTSGAMTSGRTLRWFLVVLASMAIGLSATLYAAEADDEDLGDDAGPATPAAKAPAEGEGGPEGEAEDTAATGKQMTWLENIWNAGVIGFIIIALSFVMVAMILNGFTTVRRAKLLPQEFLDDFEAKLKNRQYPEAYQAARSNESFVARVLAAGMSKLSAGQDKAMSAMEDVGAEENMRLEHGLSYLAMVATVAPMLGLLGTVAGMISSFNVIASKATTPKASELAGGISMALMTTLMGLVVAIPAIAFYGMLRNRAARLVVEVGMVCEDILGRLTGGARPAPGGAKPSAPASGAARPAPSGPAKPGLAPSGPRPQAPPAPPAPGQPPQPGAGQPQPPQQPPQQQPPQPPPTQQA